MPESMTATRTPFPNRPLSPAWSGEMHEAALPWFTAKNSLFGFSAYSISLKAMTSSTWASGTVSTAKPPRSSVIFAPGNFSVRTAARSPLYFTISSQERVDFI